MDVRNCKKCNRLFNFVSGPNICPACREAEEAKFQEVKSFVVSNRGCGVAEVLEACEVTHQQIKQWMREERLEFSSESAVGLNCESCGCAIRLGRFCEKCKNEMANQLQGTMRKPEKVPEKKDEREVPRMRYLDR